MMTERYPYTNNWVRWPAGRKRAKWHKLQDESRMFTLCGKEVPEGDFEQHHSRPDVNAPICYTCRRKFEKAK